MEKWLHLDIGQNTDNMSLEHPVKPENKAVLRNYWLVEKDPLADQEAHVAEAGTI